MSTHNIFISWSGNRSKHAALALREWLPQLLEAATPWMSDVDIEKGSRGDEEISKALSDIKVGIVCLTPENLESLWLHYEAGALSKTINDKTRLCTYLLGGLQPQDIKPPLGRFQHTKPEKEDTRKLLLTINRAINEVPRPEAMLNKAFDKFWSDLDLALTKLPKPDSDVKVNRSLEDMVAEILDLTREEANRRNKLTMFVEDHFNSTYVQPQFPLDRPIPAKPRRFSIRNLEGATKGLGGAPRLPGSQAPKGSDNST